MKSWDAIVIGAGVIGVSLALELRKSGASVLVVDKGEPGREASWAAGGMLADFALEIPAPLQPLATASARMYPNFVHQLEADSGMKIDLRSRGTLFFLHPDHDRSSVPGPTGTSNTCHPERSDSIREGESRRAVEGPLRSSPSARLKDSFPLPAPLAELEPWLRAPDLPAFYLKERSVDPRHLIAAAIAAAHHRGVHFISHDPVKTVEIKNGKVTGVRTVKTHFSAAVVVNCAGAWSGQIVCVGRAPSPAQAERSSAGFLVVPTRPVKGQMLCVAMPKKNLVRHVVRAPDVYLIPRSDSRLVIGATLEEAGFDKQTVPETIRKLRQSAIGLVPALANAPILETWAGLRPATPDKLPILGETSTPGYFVATGHFRDGILLAPITAKVMKQLLTSQSPEVDISALSPQRFH